ncbi:discoidin domain-containing protein [Saccharothrix isguenensis]
MSRRRSLAMALAGATLVGGAITAVPGHAATPAKFEPPAGKVISFIGQDAGAIGGTAHYRNGYVDTTGIVPGGVTVYTNFQAGRESWGLHTVGLDGLEEPSNWGAGDTHAQGLMNSPTFDNSALHLSLDLVNELPNVVNGTNDPLIKRMGDWMRKQDRPIFLRIGYEFDGPWNGYDPTLYIASFRRIVDRLKADGVTNFATVWASSAGGGPLMDWYPGDEYVDWFGFSCWGCNWDVGMVALAAEHGNKPVMIAEVSPQGHRTDREDGAALWSSWYDGFFRFIRDNPSIKAVSYINADWDSQPMWESSSGSVWGNSKVQDNAYVADRWKSEMANGSWLQSSPTLFQTLGYTRRGVTTDPVPPARPAGTIEVESWVPTGGARVAPDAGASGGNVLAYVNTYLSGGMLRNAPRATSVTLRYAAPAAGTITLYVNDEPTKIAFESTYSWNSFRTVTVNVDIPAGAFLRLQQKQGDSGVNLDAMTFTDTGGSPLSRAGWHAWASSTEPGGSANAAIDGDLGTRWSSGVVQQSSAMQYLAVNTGAPHQVRKVVLDAGASSGDYPRIWEVTGSNDGQTWTVLASGAGTGPVTTITLPAGQSYQLFGINQRGSAPANWWSVAELNLYP